MARQYVFLFHGMGLHPKDEWAGSFKTTIHDALQNYAPFRGMSAASVEKQFLRFIPIGYDDIFQGFRKRTAELMGSIVGGPGVRAGVSAAFKKIADSAAAGQGAEKFFWESALDPVLWQGIPLARDAVIARVSKQIGDALKEMNDEGPLTRANVIAHSLGTSVAHDALVSLRFSAVDEILFKPDSFKWQSVSMVANVSRLLECVVPPAKVSSAGSPDVHSHNAPLDAFKVYRSCLRPGDTNSTCRKYLNFHHDGDPFTWPRAFTPPDWASPFYTEVTTSRFDDVRRVHDFELYFSDPAVHVQVLRAIFATDKLCTPAEVDAAVAAFNAKHPEHATTEFNSLHAIFDHDFDRELSLPKLAKFVVRVYQELNQ